MLRGAHSMAAPLASMMSPPLAAEYITSSDLPTMPSREPTQTKEPPESGISGAKCFITRNALSRLLWSTFLASSYSTAINGLPNCRPWFNTTTSTVPTESAAWRARLATNASSLRSPRMYRSSGCGLSSRSRRPVSSSRAPSRRKWELTACPIPLFAPVTSAVALSSLTADTPSSVRCMVRPLRPPPVGRLHPPRLGRLRGQRRPSLASILQPGQLLRRIDSDRRNETTSPTHRHYRLAVFDRAPDDLTVVGVRREAEGADCSTLDRGAEDRKFALRASTGGTDQQVRGRDPGLVAGARPVLQAHRFSIDRRVGSVDDISYPDHKVGAVGV